MLSEALGSATVSGVVTLSVPMAGAVRVQVAPMTPGVLTATTWVVPLVSVAQAASRRKSPAKTIGRIFRPPELES